MDHVNFKGLWITENIFKKNIFMYRENRTNCLNMNLKGKELLKEPCILCVKRKPSLEINCSYWGGE